MGELVREMLISYDALESRVAILENGSLAEVYFERPKRSVVGNVYLGLVRDVLPGMQSAFIDIGLEKNAFLHVDDIPAQLVSTVGTKREIQSLLRVGQPIMVQVTKDPIGTKGCRVTAEITFPGRFLVLTPFAATIGVSKKLDKEECARLQSIIAPHLSEDVGAIIRTAAQDISERDLLSDLEFLLRLWKRVSHQADEGFAPEVIYTEIDLALRLVRDVFSEDFKRLIVDDKSVHAKVVSFLKRASSKPLSKVQLHKDVRRGLFETFGIDTEIQKMLTRSIELPSGGYICIDHTEALTVVDVNTGKFIGRHDLEETLFQTNCEAAWEIARQLRLRDIGGIVVIDFIDMAESYHRNEVVRRFSAAMERDRARYKVGEISRFGLLEITRRPFSEGANSSLTEQCSCCDGRGRIPSTLTRRIAVERTIKSAIRQGKATAYLVAVNPETYRMLMAPGTNLVPRMRSSTGRYVTVVPDESCGPVEVKILLEGARRDA